MVEFLSKYFKGDKVIWGIVIGLSIFSLLAVYSSTSSLAYKYHHGNTTYFLFKQTFFLLLGIFVTFLIHMVSYKYYLGLARLFIIISVILLLVTLVLGTSLNSATRWLTLPGGISFQTSDFAKLALIIYIARHLSINQDNIKDWKTGFWPVMKWILAIVVLILPANFSTAAMVYFVAIFLLFVGRVNVKHVLRTVGVSAITVLLILTFAYQFPQVFPRGETWKARIESFMEGDSESNYQAEQAKIAVVNGGLIGKGPGNSTQRNFLPHPYSDFIYAIILEEYGLIIGGLPILLLYLYLLYRAGVIVRKSQRTFPAFLAIGLAFSLVVQAMINMAVNVNLFPVTGQTLPFVSLGGSSMIFTSGALGIIISISRTIENNPKHETATETTQDNN